MQKFWNEAGSRIVTWISAGTIVISTLSGCGAGTSAYDTASQQSADGSAATIIGWQAIPEGQGNADTVAVNKMTDQGSSESHSADSDEYQAASSESGISAGTVDAAGTEDTSSAAVSETTEDTESAGTSNTNEAAVGSTAMADLKTSLENELASYSGQWSLYLRNVDTGEEIRINDQPMVAASLIKLYVAGAYMEKVESGDLSSDNEPKMDIMLDRSDNDAANTLIDLVGKGNINSFCQQHEFTSSQINRKMLEPSSKENYTSTADCGEVLQEVLVGTYVSKSASAEIMQDLQHQQRTSKIPAGVPSGVKTANKTGELDYVENDAAIIWAPAATYILCIMSSNAATMSGARQNIVNLSSEVYQAIGQQ